MNKHISAHIALYILITAAVVVVILPFLEISPLNSIEGSILEVAHSLEGESISAIFTHLPNQNIIINTYAYIVELLMNPWNIDSPFLLRLPSALVVILLTVALFRYDGSSDRLNKSFLAALLFLSTLYICHMAYYATPIAIPSLFFILSLISLYHWLHTPNRRNTMLLVLASATATIFLGIVEPIFLSLVALCFLGTSNRGNMRNYIALAFGILGGAAFAYIVVYAITANQNTAISIFEASQILDIKSSPDTSTISIFITYILFAAFPWSLPLLISCWWLIRHPRWIIKHFITLSLLQRFGIVIFLASIPLYFFFTQLSMVVLTASLFFNLPLVGNYLLSRFDAHPTEWRISGIICAVFVGVGSSIYLILNYGVTIPIFGYELSLINPMWNAGNIIILSVIALNIYTLWRNTNSLHQNHRYLYNLIFLYLMAQTLYMGYLNDNIILR